MSIKPGFPRILVPNTEFFPFVSQPILYWTLAVLSQHNIINNALTERAMQGHGTKAIFMSKQIHWFVFYLQQKWRPHSRYQPLTVYLPTAAALAGMREMINNPK